MKISKLSPDLAFSWDKLVADSNEGWLYGLSDWLRHIVSIERWNFKDYSFGVMKEGSLVGAMPLQLTMDGRLCSTAMGPSGPMLANGLSAKERHNVFTEMIRRIRGIAAEVGAHELEISISAGSKSCLKNPQAENWLLTHGFEDISTDTWMVELNASQDELYRRLSSNAKREIKEAQSKGYRVREIVNRDEMDVYYDLHLETYSRTGATPHPKEYFLGMYDHFTARGLSKIWVAQNRKGKPVGFFNAAIYKDCALYWTSCSRSEDCRSGINYLMIWHSMCAAKEQGIPYFECGEAFTEALPGSKLKGLTDFKGKFGGRLHRFYKGRLTLGSKRVAPSSPKYLSRLKRKLIPYLGANIVSILSRWVWIWLRKFSKRAR